MTSRLQLVVLFLAACTTTCFAGPVNPPPGPVAPTPGPEPRTPISPTTTPGDANSLFRIETPGSYYLTANIQGTLNKHGIEVATGGVTIDLNGFSLIGNGSGSGAFDGITLSLSAFTHGVTVRNGTVTSWGRSGVNLDSSALTGCILADVHATTNGGTGLVGPADTTFSRCTSTANAGRGFFTTEGSVFESCTASQNLGGFSATSGCTFRACTARANSLTGFVASNGCSFENCAAYDNDAQYGFDVSTACTFTGCTASNNTGTQAISAGFECNGGCVFTACTAVGNTSTNPAPSGSTGAGFIIGNASNITGCIAATSKGDNIRADNRCNIVGNTSNEAGFGGGGSGIHVTANECRVEANHCSRCDNGIEIDGNGNFITRNICVNNGGDYVIGTNNFYGPIIDRTGTAASAVNGSSAPSTLGSTDPNANFSR